eukprot:6221478-Heterocapsa_arctica.AAC.1
MLLIICLTFTTDYGFDRNVLASKAFVDRARLAGLYGCSYQCPSLDHVDTGAGQFKVVHVNHKQKLKFRVPVDTRPVSYDGETALDELRFTMCLPVPPSVWVA